MFKDSQTDFFQTWHDGRRHYAVQFDTILNGLCGARIAQSLMCWARCPVWWSIVGCGPPIKGIFPLDWTQVLTPFPTTLLDESVKQGLVCAHMHCIAQTQKIPDIHVLDGWMPATKTYPACTIHKTECDYLYGLIEKRVTYAKISPKNGIPWECRRRMAFIFLQGQSYEKCKKKSLVLIFLQISQLMIMKLLCCIYLLVCLSSYIFLQSTQWIRVKFAHFLAKYTIDLHEACLFSCTPHSWYGQSSHIFLQSTQSIRMKLSHFLAKHQIDLGDAHSFSCTLHNWFRLNLVCCLDL